MFNAISTIQQSGLGYSSSVPYAIEGLQYSITSGPTTSSFQQGVLLYKGVLYNVPAFSQVSSGPFYGTFSVYNDPIYDGSSGTVFSNGSAHFIHNNTSINISSDSSGALFNATQSIVYLSSIPTQITNALNTTPFTGWGGLTVVAASGYINVTSFAPQIISNGWGQIYLRGGAITAAASAPTNGLVMNLPLGYRPAKEMFINTSGIDVTTSANYSLPLQILSSGQVFLNGFASYTGGIQINFDGITFINS